MKWQLGDAVKLVLQAPGIDRASFLTTAPNPHSPAKRAYIKSLPAKYKHIASFRNKDILKFSILNKVSRISCELLFATVIVNC